MSDESNFCVGDTVTIAESELTSLQDDVEASYGDHTISQRDYDTLMDNLTPDGRWVVTRVKTDDDYGGCELAVVVGKRKVDGPWVVETQYLTKVRLRPEGSREVLKKRHDAEKKTSKAKRKRKSQ